MVYGVHSNTTGLGPAVTLNSVLVEGTTSLQEGLVNTTTTSNDTDNGTRGRGDDLLGTRGKTDTGLTIITMTNNGSIVTRGTGNGSTVTNLLFDVTDNGTFGHGSQRQDVTNVQRGLLTGIDELTSVHTFSGNEGLGAELVLVRVTEDNLGKGSTTSRIVNNLLDNTANVTMTFGKVENSKLGGTLTANGVRFEDTSSTFSLSTNDATHFKSNLYILILIN
jgi:hypothetical protein